MNLWIGLLVIVLLFLCEWRGYYDGKRIGFERGYCKGRTDANLWWVKLEEGVDEARQIIWRERG